MSPSSRMLVLSASDERDDVLEAVKAGATGYLVKSASKQELGDAVRATAEGRAVFTRGSPDWCWGSTGASRRARRRARPTPEPDRTRDRGPAPRRERVDGQADRDPAVVEPPHRREPRAGHVPQAAGRQPRRAGPLRNRTRPGQDSRVVLLIRKWAGHCDDDAMTEPHRAVIARLSADFAAISQQLARVSTDLTELDRLLSERPAPLTPVAAPPAHSSGRGAVLAAVPAAVLPPQYAPQQYQPPPPCRRASDAAAATRRRLDRQGTGRRRRHGHPDRRRAAAGAGRAGRHPASRDPRRRRERRWPSALVASPAWLYAPARRAGRCDRAGRHRCRGGVHGRHRHHDHLRLGVCTRRSRHRRGHRRRRADPGPALGFRAPRCCWCWCR